MGRLAASHPQMTYPLATPYLARRHAEENTRGANPRLDRQLWIEWIRFQDMSILASRKLCDSSHPSCSTFADTREPGCDVQVPDQVIDIVQPVTYYGALAFVKPDGHLARRI